MGLEFQFERMMKFWSSAGCTTELTYSLQNGALKMVKFIMYILTTVI